MQKITVGEIQRFYKEYKKNLRRQDDYEDILYFLYMKEEQKGKWFSLLQEKSVFQRKMFNKNEQDIKRVMQPFLTGEEKLVRETADAFLEEIMKMARQNIFDSLLTVEILKKLVLFYEKNGERDKKILSWFYLGYFYGYMNNMELKAEILKCCQKVISYREEYDDIADPLVRRTILSAFFERKNWDMEDRKKYSPRHMQNLLEAYEFYGKEKGKELLSRNFDMEEIQRNLKDEICMELLKPGGDRGRDQKLALLEEGYYRNLRTKQENQRLTSREFYNYQKREKALGRIGERDYYQRLYAYYGEEPQKGAEKGVGHNFNNKRQMMPLFLPELFQGAKRFYPEWFKGLKEDVKWYYTNFSRTGNKAFIDRLITGEIMELLPYYDQADAMELYEKVLLTRLGGTAIHIKGVAKLVVEIAFLMVEKHPEYLVGAAGTRDREEVLRRKDEVFYFLYQSALQHDRGKVFISTTITMQQRSLTKQEFENIRQHPQYGLKGGEGYPGLKKYYNVILGHHKFYNGKGGYPEEFDNTACPDKCAIDLITICDCLDAATDQLGRNYMKSKTVAQVLDEMDAEKGTRYSPKIVDFIRSEPELIKRLEDITSEGRKEVYYEVYHCFAREKEERRP